MAIVAEFVASVNSILPSSRPSRLEWLEIPLLEQHAVRIS